MQSAAWHWDDLSGHSLSHSGQGGVGFHEDGGPKCECVYWVTMCDCVIVCEGVGGLRERREREGEGEGGGEGGGEGKRERATHCYLLKVGEVVSVKSKEPTLPDIVYFLLLE